MRLPATEKLKRGESVKRVGLGVCKAFNKYIAMQHDIADAVTFQETAVTAYVDAYADVLFQFKTKHNFKDNSLANPSKRAAAWVVAGKGITSQNGVSNNLVDDLFKFNDDVLETIYIDLVPAHFLLSLRAAYLEVKLNNINVRLEYELLHNLLHHRNEATMEWMVTQMHALALASGAPPMPEA